MFTGGYLRVRPDCIIETGIAHGGSVIFNASMLALLEYCDAEKNNSLIDPKNQKIKLSLLILI